MSKDSGLLGQNKKAFHNYLIEEKFEAGIVLIGCEVKSLRKGECTLTDSYIQIKDGELWLHHCYISPFKEGNRYNDDPSRLRKLLVKKYEIIKLEKKLKQQQRYLIPLRFYLKGNRIKLSVGLCKSKKLFDKRQTLKERSIKKDIQRQIKSRSRY